MKGDYMRWRQQSWPDYRVFKRLLAGALLALLFPVHGLTQSPSRVAKNLKRLARP
jgi:hypothetical protein